MKKIKTWLKSFTFYNCQGYWSESNSNAPSEFDCEAENAGFPCERCLVNGGLLNPDTGKKDYIRFFFMNYKRWLRKNFKHFRKCKNCFYSYCQLDVISDWRCKQSGEHKMIEPCGYCENYLEGTHDV